MVRLDVHVDHAADRTALERAEAIDFAIALTAGPNAWVMPDSASTPMVRAGLSVALVGLMAMATLAVTEVVVQNSGRGLFEQVLLA